MHPKELQKLLDKVEGTPEEAFDQPSDAALHEAGEIHDRKHRTFWPGGQILYTFYISYQEIPGSADSSDH